jgi:hypothetical protein
MPNRSLEWTSAPTLDVIKFVALTLVIVCNPAFAAKCLSYHGEVTLEGTLSSHTFAEQPNYESIAKGDAAATYYFMVPRAPFCVAEGDKNDNQPAEPRVKRVQLVFLSREDSYGLLRPYLGKAVECRGNLFHAISGHHHSAVLLSDAKCNVTRPFSQPEP